MDEHVKIRKVFDSFWAREEGLLDAIHKVNCEFHNNGNDSLFAWTINGEEEGAGWITEAEEALINKWLIASGGEPDEKVIISHSW